jgi:hypothetical protein
MDRRPTLYTFHIAVDFLIDPWKGLYEWGGGGGGGVLKKIWFWYYK